MLHGKPQLDGSYVLKFPYSREPELVMDILKYGADVEVLAPDSLRKAVAEQHAEAAKLYAKCGTCARRSAKSRRVRIPERPLSDTP